MKVYLVGGAVRDELLGRPVHERDWVVVGGTAEALVRDGYLPVGKDFPVFLHPQTHEEYALARRERKVAPGYRGFVTEFDPDVGLEDDLRRRDLTINAMARSPEGELIDPYGGRTDIESRVLRHVSEAFTEDPVRILRVARFAARYAPLGFHVADETRRLMAQMVRNGEVTSLVPERVWQETRKALEEDQPQVFFEVLRETGALRAIFPEIDALWGVPQPEKWHPEIDTGIHTMMALAMAARLSKEPTMRFATLVHDLGKAATPKGKLPSHPGHEAHSVELIQALSERLRIPNEFKDLAIIVAREHGNVHRAHELRPATILDLLERADAFRRPDRFELALLACEADARGRKGLENRAYDAPERLRMALEVTRAIVPGTEQTTKLNGSQIGEWVRKHRIAAIAAMPSTGSPRK
jgi:tRNA nucleotidyltransferase (CCA-adding enzyme)